MEGRLNELGFHNVSLLPVNGPEDYQRLESVDSIIVIGKKSFLEENVYFKNLKNVIFVDYDFDYHKYDCVLSDFTDAVTMAMDYMAECGMRKIGYIGSWDYVNDFSNDRFIRKMDSRQEAFEKYAELKELTYKPYLYIGEKFTRAVGYELAQKAIQSGQLPEAFLIGADPMAMGVYRAFSEAGIRIGKDIRMISIDNIEDTEYLSPPLTTVMIQAYQMKMCRGFTGTASGRKNGSRESGIARILSCERKLSERKQKETKPLKKSHFLKQEQWGLITSLQKMTYTLYLLWPGM